MDIYSILEHRRHWRRWNMISFMLRTGHNDLRKFIFGATYVKNMCAF